MTKPIVALVLLLGMSVHGFAADQSQADAAERARIASERSQIEATFQAEEKACYAKFGASGCIEDARARRSAQLGDLRRQEISLNDAQRKARAADRQKELDRKRSDEARKQSEAAATGAARSEARARRADDKATKARERAAKVEERPAPAASEAVGAQDAHSPAPSSARARTNRSPLEKPPDTEQSRRRYEQRQLDAQAHKARVQERAAEQQKKNKPVNPLPTPP
jgi:colicin import membrane protein